MAKIKWVVFDCEANGLEPTKFYCLSYKDHDGQKGTLRDYQDIRDFFSRYEMYVGHNVRRWDIPNLQRVVGIRLCDEARVVDTLAVSWYLEPERGKYGLESYGEDFGVPKPKIQDWDNQTQDDYEHRCEQDVEINFRLWKDQLRKLFRIYDSSKDLLRFLSYLDFKMYSAYLAEKSMWRLDVEEVRKSIERIEKERDDKVSELKAAMPRVPVRRTYNPPKRIYNSDGQLSVLGQRWKERLVEGGFPEGHDGPVELIVGYDDPNPQSPEQIKGWLYSLGWRPRTIKYDRNKKTGEVKEIPQVNLPNGGGLCESVLELADKDESILALEGLGVAKHRLGLLNGYLRDCRRIGDQYFLQARVAGLTNTLRFKHAEIVNLPKVEKKYGRDIRGPLVSRMGHELCGSDMSSLEDRIKQHFIYPHDPDYVDELNRPDYDPHLDLAHLAGAITKDEMDGYKAGVPDVVKKVKPIRSIYKNGNYACQYGAGVSRLAITCACDEKTARKVHETYWKRNWAIKEVADEQKVKEVDGQLWLLNPINRFWYSLRTKKDIFSTLVQGSAAYCFDTWLRFILSRRKQITGQFHDEVILEIKEGHRHEATKLLTWAIERTNKFLGLNRELGIDIQFGTSYAEIH